MSVVSANMTQDAFAAAIAENFHHIGTPLFNLPREKYLEKLNENFKIYCKTYVKDNTELVTTKRGLDFIAAINNNFALRVDGSNFDLLTIQGSQTFSPAIATNEYLAKYKAFKLGGMISFSIYTFDYNFTKPLNPYIFNLTDIDIDTWVSKAADAGIEYLYLTVWDNTGFALFDNPYPYPDYLINQCYGYKKYDVAIAGADLHIVDKFVTACHTYGIEPCFYVCTTSNGAFVFKRPNYSVFRYIDMTTTDREYFNNYAAKLIQYLISTWGIKYLWLDVAGTGAGNLNNMQLYYNAVKSIDPTCQVIGNTIGDIAFAWYPYDIGSNETDWSLHDSQTWDGVLNTLRTKNGTDYYVPQEVVTNNFDGMAGSSWYWNNQALKPQGTIQSLYDIAKAHGSPFLLNLAPNTKGIISDEQFSLFSNLTL